MLTVVFGRFVCFETGRGIVSIATYAFPLMFCGVRRHVNVGSNWGSHALREYE